MCSPSAWAAAEVARKASESVVKSMVRFGVCGESCASEPSTEDVVCVV